MVYEEFVSEWHNSSEYVSVHTSGSTGIPKQMYVEKKRMAASARTTCEFLGLKAGDTALLCMPLDYIAGKMMVVRSIVCGLKLIYVEPCGHPLKDIRQQCKGNITFAAMVPMQVYNSMQVPEEREILCSIKHLIIGGGAISNSLEAGLKDFPNAVWSTYGMTETLSHIALRRINGKDSSCWYTPFNGISVKVNHESCLVIDAPQVCKEVITTNDIAEINADGRRFKILGRKDNTVCSGGIKIQIEEVEDALRPYMKTPFLITKKKDDKFGEILVLMMESGDMPATKEICKKVLPKYKQPRIYLHVEKLPMTETGKPARQKAMFMVRDKEG